jgi:hypothetical protein
VVPPVGRARPRRVSSVPIPRHAERAGSRAHQSGVLSPNDVRREEGWPASTNPTADSIEPPVSGGKPADATADDTPAHAPTADEPAKVALLDQHRGRNA